MNHIEHKLTLLENSDSFTKEAIEKAILAQEDYKEWKFALIHIVQALELSLKEILKRTDLDLVYENRSRSERTVKIDQAIERIDKKLNRPLKEIDIKTIKKAQGLRNQLVHFEFSISIEDAKLIFAKLVCFIDYIHISYLDRQLLEFLTPTQHDFVVLHGDFADELSNRAFERIAEEGILEETITNCPYCDVDSFVFDYNTREGYCYICRYTADVKKCSKCEGIFTSEQIKDFSQEFEYSQSEGLSFLENDFGYSSEFSCRTCLPYILEDIEYQRIEERHEYLEMEYYYSQNKA